MEFVSRFSPIRSTPLPKSTTLEWTDAFSASLGWRPFVPEFIAEIIKRKFVNLPPMGRGQDPFPKPFHKPSNYHTKLLLSFFFLWRNLDYWATRRKRRSAAKKQKGKTSPHGVCVAPCIVHVNVCPCWFGPCGIPPHSELRKWDLQLNVLICLLGEKPHKQRWALPSTHSIIGLLTWVCRSNQCSLVNLRWKINK